MAFDSNFTTDIESHQTRQLNTYLIQLLIRRKCILFWLKCFLLLNPLNIKSKRSRCEFQYFTLNILHLNVLLACKKISENQNNKRTEEKYFLIDKEQG